MDPQLIQIGQGQWIIIRRKISCLNANCFVGCFILPQARYKYLRAIENDFFHSDITLKKSHGYKYHTKDEILLRNIPSISHFLAFFTHFFKCSTSATENLAEQLT